MQLGDNWLARLAFQHQLSRVNIMRFLVNETIEMANVENYAIETCTALNFLIVSTSVLPGMFSTISKSKSYVARVLDR